MALYVGQKVACVGGSEQRLPPHQRMFWRHWRQYWGVATPAKGSVYTIREIRLRKDGTLGLRLVEVINPACEWNDAPPQEPWYHATDFRPVVERKTDISIFTAMLNPSDERVSA
jgi:hypothetical protein